MILVDTFVAGLPRTKGSLAKRPNGTLYDSVTDSGKWRALMAGAVRDDLVRRWALPDEPGVTQPWRSAVMVVATFWLPCDPIAYAAGDLDKLARNLLDALGTHSKNPRYNGGVIVDDNQVTDLRVAKRGPAPLLGMTAGCGVTIRVEAVDLSAMHGVL